MARPAADREGIRHKSFAVSSFPLSFACATGTKSPLLRQLSRRPKPRICSRHLRPTRLCLGKSHARDSKAKEALERTFRKPACAYWSTGPGGCKARNTSSLAICTPRKGLGDSDSRVRGRGHIDSHCRYDPCRNGSACSWEAMR